MNAHQSLLRSKKPRIQPIVRPPKYVDEWRRLKQVIGRQFVAFVSQVVSFRAKLKLNPLPFQRPDHAQSHRRRDQAAQRHKKQQCRGLPSSESQQPQNRPQGRREMPE
jgi:hypothetical protein